MKVPKSSAGQSLIKSTDISIVSNDARSMAIRPARRHAVLSLAGSFDGREKEAGDKPKYLLEEYYEIELGERNKAFINGKYILESNYWNFGHDDAYNPHIGWKAHVGAKNHYYQNNILNKVGSWLRENKVEHKFDASNDKILEKFLTIYPSENISWKEIISNIDGLIENKGIKKGITEVPGCFPVGEHGTVYMRYGQLTPLSPGELCDQTQALAKENLLICKKVSNDYSKCESSLIKDDKNMPLYMHNKSKYLLFSRNDGIPESTRTEDICLAIYYNGNIIPDCREEANPTSEPLPEGVDKYLGAG
jgi:hypothetical protein